MFNRLAVATFAAVVAIPLGAQESTEPVVTAADYARAETFLRGATTPLVFGATVRPTWIGPDRFWYRNAVPGGAEFISVDGERGTRDRLFDHDRVAEVLSSASGQEFGALGLPAIFDVSEGGASLDFAVGRTRFICARDGSACEASGVDDERRRRDFIRSPDGSLDAFIRDHNLWVRAVTDRTETQLTTDGIEDFGYATDNAGWTKSDRPVLLWSPDSRKIATFQHDGRGVGEMYLVSTEVGHPELEAWKYPLPEDSVIFRISRVVIDVEEATVVRLQMEPDQHRSTLCDHVRCRGADWSDVEWSPDGSQLAFVSSSRDHKEAHLRVADPETGAVRDVLDETVETFYESGFGRVNWHMLAESEEVIWFSQQDDWGHLYLHDLNSGELKHQITNGDWNVLQLIRIDEEARRLYFTGAGREPGDPYFQYFYSIGMDGQDLRLLTPDSANHTISLSPSGASFVDSYSTPVEPPVTVLRDLEGNEVLVLEAADITHLEDAGWHPPTPFTVKARDGVTVLYGLMYRPSSFDSSKSYPVINYLYPGPQTGSVGSRSFNPSRSDKQAIAELGFIVVEVDAMGTPMRSKSFHEAYYGNMGDNGLPDQVAMVRQLAERHPWMDLERVGIWGHSGGGFASTAGILRYPDFYKVAVSQAGNHDNRNYEDDWGEKWQGLLEISPDGSTSYDNQANQLLVGNLKGKLLIAHGTMDSNVPPSNTMLMVDALIEANKDFDLIMLPNRRHGFGNEPYMMRRRWDYFVRHLLGAEPPSGYEIGARRPIS